MSRVMRAVLIIAMLILSPLLPGNRLVSIASLHVLPAIVAPDLAPDAAVQWDGLAVGDDGALSLTGQAAPWSEAPFQIAGTLVGQPVTLPGPTSAIQAVWQGEAPATTSVRLEVRGWTDAGPMPWEEAGVDSVVRLGAVVDSAQYRLTLLAETAAVSPRVSGVELHPATVVPEADAAPLTAAQATPATSSLRLYATRIGLIGRTTANGTVIAPEDRFVALPSRRVLAVKGSRDYEVRIEYKGRSVTVPVWDIGPWNVRDNYWDAPSRRDMWNDLPASRPQSVAAYFDAYHGGRDGFGRRVLSPAAIDISDAAFYELGMVNGDWVQVTLLWQPRR